MLKELGTSFLFSGNIFLWIQAWWHCWS